MPQIPLATIPRLALASLASFAALTLASCGGDGDRFPAPSSPSDGGSTPPVAAEAKYSVGGSVSGLLGSGLVLQLAGAADVAVAANGDFAFGDKFAKKTSYAVSVKQQPANPAQTCTVNNASGTIADSDVTNVSVVCATTSYTVSVTVTNLDAAGGLVLQNNAGDDLAVNANGTFSFTTPVAIGADYGVTVKTQPNALQVCIARQAFGTVTTGPITSVIVACTVPGVDRLAFTADEGSNTLTRYTAAADGQLSSATSFAAGNTPQHVSVHPEGKSVYVANISGGTVTQYSIDGAGALTRLPEVTANVGSNPLFVGIEPKGRFAYVIGDGSIHRFSIDAMGALLNGAAFPGATGRKMSFDPDGRFAFAPNNGSIGVYLLDQATGDPTLVPGSVAHPSAQDIAIDPTGRFAYVDSPGTAGGAGSLSAYAINAATGALTLIGSVPTGVVPFSLTVDPTGRFVYVVNRNSNSVSAYAIEPRTGALTPVPGQPFATGSVPDSVTVDRTGRFAYTANQSDNTISFFTIDRTTGALGARVNFPSLGNRPQFLALTK